jgi:hypothetical protein
MNLPPPFGRSAAAYTPPGLTPINVETRAAVQQVADAAHAATRMNDAIAAALAFADRYADHRAPRLLDAIPEVQYTLDQFLDFALAEATDFAGDHLGPDATMAVIVPMWVHTTVQMPRTGPVYLTIPTTHPLGDSWTLYVLAAADRTPSLLTMSWDWCGVYPCITPGEWYRERQRATAGQAAA